MKTKLSEQQKHSKSGPKQQNSVPLSTHCMLDTVNTTLSFLLRADIVVHVSIQDPVYKMLFAHYIRFD